MYIADLHIHSRYSRATSRELTPEQLDALFDPEFLTASRLSPTAFTRKRSLTFPRLLAMMLSGMCASVQSELDHLFATLAGKPGRRRE